MITCNNYVVGIKSRSGCKDIWNAFMCKDAVYSKRDIPYCPTIMSVLPKRIITWEEAKKLYKKEFYKINMKNITLILTAKSSCIENEDYFSLRVVFDSSSESIQHIGFYNGTEDLLELSVSKDTGLLQKLQMTICHHYSIDNVSLDIGNIDTTNEEISLELPDHNECESFFMHVYNNCAVITLSDNTPTKRVKCGQVVFCLDDAQNILSIVITGLIQDDIDHIKNELLLQ